MLIIKMDKCLIVVVSDTREQELDRREGGASGTAEGEENQRDTRMRKWQNEDRTPYQVHFKLEALQFLCWIFDFYSRPGLHTCSGISHFSLFSASFSRIYGLSSCQKALPTTSTQLPSRPGFATATLLKLRRREERS